MAAAAIEYIPSPSQDDVLFDQLEYLLAEHRNRRHRNCPDCMRLVEIKRLLLRPFVG